MCLLLASQPSHAGTSCLLLTRYTRSGHLKAELCELLGKLLYFCLPSVQWAWRGHLELAAWQQEEHRKISLLRSAANKKWKGSSLGKESSLQDNIIMLNFKSFSVRPEIKIIDTAKANAMKNMYKPLASVWHYKKHWDLFQDAIRN